jgi:hypothetical protein
MKRLAIVLAVAMCACAKAEQQSAQQGQMADTSHAMMSADTAHQMMADTSKQMAPAPAKQP